MPDRYSLRRWRCCRDNSPKGNARCGSVRSAPGGAFGGGYRGRGRRSRRAEPGPRGFAAGSAPPDPAGRRGQRQGRWGGRNGAGCVPLLRVVQGAGGRPQARRCGSTAAGERSSPEPPGGRRPAAAGGGLPYPTGMEKPPAMRSGVVCTVIPPAARPWGGSPDRRGSKGYRPDGR